MEQLDKPPDLIQSSEDQQIQKETNQPSTAPSPTPKPNHKDSTPSIQSTQNNSTQHSVQPTDQQSRLNHSTSSQPTDNRWWIKQILWPPFPTQNNPSPRSVSILMQNLNGPCSLLAICNILLLRGSIVLPGPATRTSISFESLSAVLKDYLVRTQPETEQLERALSIIPSTQTGLDLNPSFGSIDGFHPTASDSCTPALDLFKAAGIQLVHGWVADSQDLRTWNVIVEQCGNYDKTVELVATGDALMSKQSDPLVQLSSQEESLIEDSLIARQFLDTTSTQLSYAGLFQLSTGLGHDSTAVFLRNSHLSVLYHRPYLPKAAPIPIPAPLPPPPDQTDPDYDHQTALEVHAVSQQLQENELAAGSSELEDNSSLPKLFTLVTDLSFLNEPQIVWESLEDVEGGLSEHYDWRLRKSRISNPSNSAHPTPNVSTSRPNVDPTHLVSNSNADFDLAHQLQEEEYKQASIREEAQRRNRRSQVEEGRRGEGAHNIPQRSRTIATSGPISHSITQPPPPSSVQHFPTPLRHQPPHPPVVHPLSSKKKHKDCVIV